MTRDVDAIHRLPTGNARTMFSEISDRTTYLL